MNRRGKPWESGCVFQKQKREKRGFANESVDDAGLAKRRYIIHRHSLHVQVSGDYQSPFGSCFILLSNLKETHSNPTS